MQQGPQSFWIEFRIPIFGFVVILACYGFWKWLTYVKPVPPQTVEYLKNACEEAGGGLLAGDWPVYADGYLIDRKFRPLSTPIDRSEPFLVEGFRYIEYNLDVFLGPNRLPRYKQTAPEGSGRSYIFVPFKGPYVRISVEETGHPNCGPFELERKYGSTKMPDHLCLAMVEFKDPAQLWSRYKYEEYHDHDDSGPVPIRWSALELVDRDTNQVMASVRQFALCTSAHKTGNANVGFQGCVGDSQESPQSFFCPSFGPGNYRLAIGAFDTFLEKTIRSTDLLEDGK
jgi:hypothetical protein